MKETQDGGSGRGQRAEGVTQALLLEEVVNNLR